MDSELMGPGTSLSGFITQNMCVNSYHTELYVSTSAPILYIPAWENQADSQLWVFEGGLEEGDAT